MNFPEHQFFIQKYHITLRLNRTHTKSGKQKPREHCNHSFITVLLILFITFYDVNKNVSTDRIAEMEMQESQVKKNTFRKTAKSKEN